MFSLFALVTISVSVAPSPAATQWISHVCYMSGRIDGENCVRACMCVCVHACARVLCLQVKTQTIVFCWCPPQDFDNPMFSPSHLPAECMTFCFVEEKAFLCLILSQISSFLLSLATRGKY